MGRLGPAFLAYANFDVYTQWNQSLVYATTAAYFATRLAGAPPAAERAAPRRRAASRCRRRRSACKQLGYDVGKVDGVIGAQTRAAVKAVQQQLGLPADSYPDPTFLAALGEDVRPQWRPCIGSRIRIARGRAARKAPRRR